jgi:ribosomal protein S1
MHSLGVFAMVNENIHQARSKQFQLEKEELTHAWNKIQDKLKVGQDVTGVVTRHETFGIFIDIGEIFECLLQITEFPGDYKRSIEDYPPIGSEVTARIIGFSSFQIMLTMK